MYSVVFKEIFVYVKLQLLEVKCNVIFYKGILIMANIFMTAK